MESESFIRSVWALILKRLLMSYYVKLKIKGEIEPLISRHSRLLLIAQHSSHLDGAAILAAIPFAHWPYFRIVGAHDYFFRTALSRFFFVRCVGVVPIDRLAGKAKSIVEILGLLRGREKLWLLIFPEGGRARSGETRVFKKGASIFALQTNTPLLFVYVEGAEQIWPKGQFWPRRGSLTLHIGPVHEPTSITRIEEDYRGWVANIFARNAGIAPYKMMS